MRTSTLLTVLVLGVFASGGCYDKPGEEGGEDESSTGGPGSTGAETSAASTGADSTSATASSSDDDSSDGASTGEPACLAPDGTPDDACESPTPLCLAGECVGCDALGDAGCGMVEATTPICDLESGACLPCVEHDQCETGACVLSSGACVAETNRLYVDITADCDTADGTLEAPLCTITSAMNTVESQPGEEPWAIFVAGAALPYAESLSWPSDHPLAIIGPSEGLGVEIQGGDPAVSVAGGGELNLARLVIETGPDGLGLQCFYAGAPTRLGADELFVGGGVVLDCDVIARRTRINGGGTPNVVSGSLLFEDGEVAFNGLRIEDAAVVTLRRSLVRGTIDVLGGELTAQNVFLAEETGGVIPPAFLNVTGGGTVDLVYSSVLTEFTCDGTGPTSIRNSIVVPMACPSTSIDFSAVNIGVDQGEGNAQLFPEMLGDVFLPGDLHVFFEAPVITELAVWLDGDPETDIDGDLRPNEDGARDYAGADVPTE